MLLLFESLPSKVRVAEAGSASPALQGTLERAPRFNFGSPVEPNQMSSPSLLCSIPGIAEKKKTLRSDRKGPL